MELNSRHWIWPIAFASLAVIAAAVFLSRGSPVSETVQVAEPYLYLPEPNGYDRLVDEIDRFPKTVRLQLPLYRSSIEHSDPKEILSATEAEVVRHIPALQRIEQALDLPIKAPYPDATEDLSRSIAVKEIGYVWRAKAYVEHCRGFVDEAYKSAFLAWRLGDVWAQTDAMGGNQLTGESVKSIARSEITALLALGFPSDTAHYASLLEESLGQRQSFRNVMIREVAEFQSLCARELNNADWRERLVMPLAPSPMTDAQKLLCRTISREEFYRAGVERRQEALRLASKPFRMPEPQMATSTDAHEISSYPLGNEFFGFIWGHWEYDRLYDMLLLHALALEGFKRKTGTYPSHLSELCPEFLKEQYKDPFGNGRPLAYRRTGNGFQLYSVGPDGIDQGGGMLKHSNGAAARFGELSNDLEGDIVWQVNRI